jgi:hypothetical protein
MQRPQRITVREFRARLASIVKEGQTVLVGRNYYRLSGAFIPLDVNSYASRTEKAQAKSHVRQAARAIIEAID